MNKSKIDFLIHFVIGGLIVAGINYCLKYSKTKFVALIPAVPALGIYGLFLTVNDKKDFNEYLLNISNFILISLGFYMLIFIINKFIKRIFISLMISLLIWILVVYKFCDI